MPSSSDQATWERRPEPGARAAAVPLRGGPDVERAATGAVDQPASPASADQDLGPAGRPECEVWQLLGRADVIVRGCLEAQDRGERRLWEERARVWLQDVDGAWLRSQRRPW